jgi:YVTN family beta-propeller protein
LVAQRRSLVTVGLIGAVIIVGIVGAFSVLSSTGGTTTTPTTNPSSNENPTAPSSSSSSCSFSENNTNINLPVRFQALTFDGLNNKLYGIGNNNNNNGFENVYEFSPQDNSVTAVANLSSASSDIVYDSLDNSFYVASYGLANSVIVINASKNYQVIKTIPLTGSPSALAFDPDKNEIYVSSYESKTVFVINGSTNEEISAIGTNLNPAEFVYVSQNKEMYLSTVSFNTSRSEVDVLNTTTNSINSRILLAGNGYSLITYDHANGDLYLASSLSNNITIISTKSNEIIGSAVVPYDPSAISYDPTNLDVYVATNATGGAIYVIDSAYNTVNTPVSGIGGIVPLAFTYDSHNGILYLTSSNTNEIIAISTNQRSLSCLTKINPLYTVSISNPYLVSTPSNHTFVISYSITANQGGLLYYNGTLSHLTRFSGNPEWNKVANGSWVPTNSSSLSGSTDTPLWKISQAEIDVRMNQTQILANQTTQFVFHLDVGSALSPGYYGLVLIVYLELSSYPSIPIIYTGYIPIEVIA